MCKKGKTLLGFVNKLFILVQLIFFLDHVLLSAELAQYTLTKTEIIYPENVGAPVAMDFT